LVANEFSIRRKFLVAFIDSTNKNSDADNQNSSTTGQDSYNVDKFDLTSIGKLSTPKSIDDSQILDEVNLPTLSYREKEVLQYLAIGLSPEQIALKLSIKTRTVRKHLNNLRNKFDSESRDQLMARAGYLGLCYPYK
jgi:DNA-binding CsgD family transcriptional regulator